MQRPRLGFLKQELHTMNSPCILAFALNTFLLAAEGPDLAEIRKVFQQAITIASEIQEQNAKDTVLAEIAEGSGKDWRCE
jgi:hypothetical protein